MDLRGVLVLGMPCAVSMPTSKPGRPRNRVKTMRDACPAWRIFPYGDGCGGINSPRSFPCGGRGRWARSRSRSRGRSGAGALALVGGHFAAAEDFDLDPAVGLQALDELAVAAALGPHLAACVAGDRL